MLCKEVPTCVEPSECRVSFARSRCAAVLRRFLCGVFLCCGCALFSRSAAAFGAVADVGSLRDDPPQPDGERVGKAVRRVRRPVDPHAWQGGRGGASSRWRGGVHIWSAFMYDGSPAQQLDRYAPVYIHTPSPPDTNTSYFGFARSPRPPPR